MLTNFHNQTKQDALRHPNRDASADSVDVEDDKLHALGVSDHAREVVRNGSTAINYLVWRRSMMWISIVALTLNLLNHFINVLSLLGYRMMEPASADNLDAEGEVDVFSVIVSHVTNACYLLCEVQGLVGREGLGQGILQGSDGSSRCTDLCDSLVSATTGTAIDEITCPATDQSMEARENTDESSDWTWTGSMQDKFKLYKVIGELFKCATTTIALVLVRQAEKRWKSVQESSALVAKGWVLVFATPLLLSTIPWYIFLNFPGEFEDDALMAQVPGYLKGSKFKLQIGTAVYLQTQAVALALCKAGLKATMQCKILIPRSGLWTQAFFLVPMLTVVLQWPLFGVGPCQLRPSVCFANNVAQPLSYLSQHSWARSSPHSASGAS